MIDTAVVKKAIQGDVHAFGELYESLSGELYRVALYTLQNPQDAEDVVAETFLEAYKGIKNLSSPEKVKGWFFTILSARCKRQIAKYVRRKDHMELGELAEYGIEPVAKEQVGSESLEMENALAEITGEERTIVALSVLEGYTVKEIGQILDLPQGTVSSKLYRAFKKLRMVLA